jgi:hypothetical protein
MAFDAALGPGIGCSEVKLHVMLRGNDLVSKYLDGSSDDDPASGLCSSGFH